MLRANDYRRKRRSLYKRLKAGMLTEEDYLIRLKVLNKEYADVLEEQRLGG